MLHEHRLLQVGVRKFNDKELLAVLRGVRHGCQLAPHSQPRIDWEDCVGKFSFAS
jgi:hypothetical protein